MLKKKVTLNVQGYAKRKTCLRRIFHPSQELINNRLHASTSNESLIKAGAASLLRTCFVQRVEDTKLNIKKRRRRKKKKKEKKKRRVLR